MQSLKRAVVGVLGRERANRLSAPFHDWRAQQKTRERLASLPQSDLYIHLGCGLRPLDNWINVDIARGDKVDIVWDLRSGLPFRDNSCAAIFSEHVIEHVSRHDAESLLRECHRVLQPGGVLRLSTPDAGRYLRSYATDGEFLRHPDFIEPIETPLDRVNMMMREYGQHLWVYDAESLALLLQKAGFSTTTEQSYGVSSHPNLKNIDAAERAFESLYVEAVK